MHRRVRQDARRRQSCHPRSNGTADNLHRKGRYHHYSQLPVRAHQSRLVPKFWSMWLEPKDPFIRTPDKGIFWPKLQWSKFDSEALTDFEQSQLSRKGRGTGQGRAQLLKRTPLFVLSELKDLYLNLALAPLTAVRLNSYLFLTFLGARSWRRLTLSSDVGTTPRQRKTSTLCQPFSHVSTQSSSSRYGQYSFIFWQKKYLFIDTTNYQQVKSMYLFINTINYIQVVIPIKLGLFP